jgi:hypothetical protein
LLHQFRRGNSYVNWLFLQPDRSHNVHLYNASTIKYFLCLFAAVLTNTSVICWTKLYFSGRTLYNKLLQEGEVYFATPDVKQFSLDLRTDLSCVQQQAQYTFASLSRFENLQASTDVRGRQSRSRRSSSESLRASQPVLNGAPPDEKKRTTSELQQAMKTVRASVLLLGYCLCNFF